jgi:hypothetical protein
LQLKYKLMFLKMSWELQGTVKHARAKLTTTAVLFILLVSTNAQGANPLGLSPWLAATAPPARSATWLCDL